VPFDVYIITLDLCPTAKHMHKDFCWKFIFN